MDTELEEARRQMEILIDSCRSVVLGTATHDGAPLSSYAPVYVEDSKCLYVYVSALAKHYAHLKRTGKASAMFIEDESKADNLFARKRLTLDCQGVVIERNSEEWEPQMVKMEIRLGETMGFLKDLKDFDLFELTPRTGRLVLGFGKAYDVKGEGLQYVDYVGGGGHKK
jgi:putative heme iron utilization protein